MFQRIENGKVRKVTLIFILETDREFLLGNTSKIYYSVF